MNDITTLGIDLAKNAFQLSGLNKQGKRILNKRVSCSKLLAAIRQQPSSVVIAMEACSSAHYWARCFQTAGYTVKLIAPQFVKPFVSGNKNDANDALAIAEAATRPMMRFVPIKSTEAQDIQSLHPARALAVKNRTALANQLRGLLAEYGLILAQGISKLRLELQGLLNDTENTLSPIIRRIMQDIYADFKHLDARVLAYEKNIRQWIKTHADCQRLMQLPGVGPLTATALVAAVGNGADFKCGREMAAWLGLTPKHRASGQKLYYQGISKRGDRYLRTLLIHGARAVLRHCHNKTGYRYQWIQQKLTYLPMPKVAVALANKMAREIWAILRKGDEFTFSF